MGLSDDLTARFGERVRLHVPLGPLTTFQVGGVADVLFEPASAQDVLLALKLAHRWGVPVHILGGGSNVLVSDLGVRGLVIRPRHGDVCQPADDVVRADAAVTINGLVRWTIGRGLSGLEAWAGTPGTVGGAVYGNAHFRGRLLSEHVVRTCLATRAGHHEIVPADQMDFDYDHSRLHESGEVLLWCEFRVGRGEPDHLRAEARASLSFRKQTQPLHMPSAGCIFQNPGANESMPSDVPRSAGALIDRAGLKGAAVGRARVSTVHANFIVNEGSASASDIRELIELCRARVRDRFGIVLRDEIVYLGQF